MKTARIVAAAALSVSSAFSPLGSLAADMAVQPGVTRLELQRHNLSIPGWEVVQVRVDIAERASAAPHKHPGEEVIYVLSGTLEYRVAGKQPLSLKAGDVLFIPYGVVHSAKNIGTGTGSE